MSLTLDSNDLVEIQAQVAEEWARDFKVFMADKSINGFYLRLAADITHDNVNVIAEGADEGLLKYILDERPYLLLEFVTGKEYEQ